MTEGKGKTGSTVKTKITTDVKRAMLTADMEAQYDEKAKRILSNKIILAHILSQTVKEFAGMPPKEIIPLIEGDTYVEQIPVDPGLTNEKTGSRGERITGFNTENLEVNEGVCFFDIIFYVRTRKGIRRMIINMEVQKEKPGSYQLFNRGIFYNCRIVSSQKERDFKNDNYDDILPVHSIWIMMNQKEDSLTHFHLSEENLLNKVHWRGQIDAINVYMLGLGKKLPEYDEEHKLHRLLGTIFSTTLSKEKKIAIMEQEYNIAMEEELGEEMEDMGSFSYYVKQEGIEIGIQQGIEQERERSEKLLAERDDMLAEKDAVIESLKRQLAALS